jgi:nitrous oxide reductase accessory protein NosL
MKRNILALCTILMALLCILNTTALAVDDISEHRSCNFCGMDRKAYGYSRMLISYGDGTSSGVCSLQCAVTEMSGNGQRQVKSLLVADRNTHTLISAEKAFWVMGGKKRGVMTDSPKWAFATLEAAQAFATSYGGSIIIWETALASAREELSPKPRR